MSSISDFIGGSSNEFKTGDVITRNDTNFPDKVVNTGTVYKQTDYPVLFAKIGIQVVDNFFAISSKDTKEMLYFDSLSIGDTSSGTNYANFVVSMINESSSSSITNDYDNTTSFSNNVSVKNLKKWCKNIYRGIKFFKKHNDTYMFFLYMLGDGILYGNTGTTAMTGRAISKNDGTTLNSLTDWEITNNITYPEICSFGDGNGYFFFGTKGGYSYTTLSDSTTKPFELSTDTKPGNVTNSSYYFDKDGTLLDYNLTIQSFSSTSTAIAIAYGDTLNGSKLKMIVSDLTGLPSITSLVYSIDFKEENSGIDSLAEFGTFKSGYKDSIEIGLTSFTDGSFVYFTPSNTPDVSLTGSVYITNRTIVDGVGTLFTTEVNVGDYISVQSGHYFKVKSIESNTALTIYDDHTATNGISSRSNAVAKSTGSSTVTLGSNLIVGTSTTYLTDFSDGDYFELYSSTGRTHYRSFHILTVDSDTQMTLAENSIETITYDPSLITTGNITGVVNVNPKFENLYGNIDIVETNDYIYCIEYVAPYWIGHGNIGNLYMSRDLINWTSFKIPTRENKTDIKNNFYNTVYNDDTNNGLLTIICAGGKYKGVKTGPDFDWSEEFVTYGGTKNTFFNERVKL